MRARCEADELRACPWQGWWKRAGQSLGMRKTTMQGCWLGGSFKKAGCLGLARGRQLAAVGPAIRLAVGLKWALLLMGLQKG